MSCALRQRSKRFYIRIFWKGIAPRLVLHCYTNQ
jgi:hypothetical protein